MGAMEFGKVFKLNGTKLANRDFLPLWEQLLIVRNRLGEKGINEMKERIAQDKTITNKSKAFRWDLLHSIPSGTRMMIVAQIYQYTDDVALDVALKRIVLELFV